MRLVPVLGLIALSSALFAGGPTTEQMLALSKAAATLSEGASITTRIGGETVRITRKDGQAQVTLQGTTYRVPVAPAQPTGNVVVPVVQQIQQGQLAAAPANSIFRNNVVWLGTTNTSMTNQQALTLAARMNARLSQANTFWEQMVGTNNALTNRWYVKVAYGPYGTASLVYNAD